MSDTFCCNAELQHSISKSAFAFKLFLSEQAMYVNSSFRTHFLKIIYRFLPGRVGAPLTVVHPSQNSGRAAFPHPALCETNRSHYHSYILTYIRGLICSVRFFLMYQKLPVSDPTVVNLRILEKF